MKSVVKYVMVFCAIATSVTHAENTMSFQKEAIVGGVAVAAITLGGVALYKYFVKSPSTKVKIKPQEPSLAEFPPFQAPDSVEDKTDVKALKKRLKQIEKQKYYKVNGWKFYNPNFDKNAEHSAIEELKDAKAVQKRIEKEETAERREELYQEAMLKK